MKPFRTPLIAALTGLISALSGTLIQAQTPIQIIDPRSFGLSASAFSARLAISGDRIAVEQALNTGIVHIFSIQGNAVTKLNTLTTSDWVEYSRFGYSLGLAGDVLYAGCPNTWRVGAHDGTAYLYNNLGSNPTLVSEWTEFPSQWAGYFGQCGSLRGDVLVVTQGSNPEWGSRGGAFFYRVDGLGNRTSIFSFMAPDTDRYIDGLALSSNRCAVVWNSYANREDCQLLVLDMQRDAANAFSGVSTNAVIGISNFVGTALQSTGCDGDLVAVGEPQYAIGTNQCGRVRVWRVGAGNGSLVATLTSPDSFNGGGFGECVYLKNNTLFVGSPTVPGVSNAQGCVYIYDIPTAGSPILLRMIQPAAPAVGSGEYFGNPITSDGGRLIVGSSGGEGRGGNGVVYVYDAALLIDVGPVPPRPALGTPTLVSGFVVGVNLADGGSGYTNTPLVRVIGGGGSGAQAVAMVSNGVVVAINVLNAGYGYTNTPAVVIAPPFIANPSLGIAPMTVLSFSNLTVGGSYQLQRHQAWYWTNEPTMFTASSSTYTQRVAGAADSQNYRLALSPAPSQAFATPQVVNGFVVGGTITAGGSGYVTNPRVNIAGGGGSNATAVASVTGGVVNGLAITSAGIGYTNTPTIRIDPPPAATLSPAVVPVMRLEAANLSPYDSYQVQFKPALNAAWANWSGGLFASTNSVSTQYLFITNGAGFFRVQYAP